MILVLNVCSITGNIRSDGPQIQHQCAECLSATCRSSTQTLWQWQPALLSLSIEVCWMVSSRCSPYISVYILCVSLSQPELSASTAKDKTQMAGYSILPCPLSHPSYINPCASKKSYHSWLNSTQTHILPLHNCPAWQGQLGSTPWPRSDIWRYSSFFHKMKCEGRLNG